MTKDYDKSENDLKALQSVGQVTSTCFTSTSFISRWYRSSAKYWNNWRKINVSERQTTAERMHLPFIQLLSKLPMVLAMWSAVVDNWTRQSYAPVPVLPWTWPLWPSCGTTQHEEFFWIIVTSHALGICHERWIRWSTTCHMKIRAMFHLVKWVVWVNRFVNCEK